MEGNLPGWIQQAGIIAIALVSAIVGVFKYLKTEASKEKTAESGSLVAATFLDPKLVRELITTLIEHKDELARESKKIVRANQDARDAIMENSEALGTNTDTMLNLVRFIKSRDRAREMEFEQDSRIP